MHYGNLAFMKENSIQLISFNPNKFSLNQKKLH